MTMSTLLDLHRRIIDQIAEAIIYADTKGIIREWNGAAEHIFGFPKVEAIGQSLDLIIPERLRRAHWEAFDRAMERGSTAHSGHASLTRAINRKGETIYVEMSFAVVTDDDHLATGSVAVARDVTERERAARQ
ncbi:PAS domain S-box protein [Paludibacterium sp. dN 18-1]|uniref:PAS domain S-box protein n=2 Tax=Paludibacterium denitrificans TaxID=2675226 RepID=A0A844GG69_9NEIS|nr:PAS domain S-box protein [Paludibacterium denitrificans]